VSLQNLLKIGQIKEHPTDPEEVERLQIAAQRNCTIHRPPASVLKHVSDTLRRQRNVTDYTRDLIDESTVANGIEEAKHLLADVLEWRKTNGPN